MHLKNKIFGDNNGIYLRYNWAMSELSHRGSSTTAWGVAVAVDRREVLAQKSQVSTLYKKHKNKSMLKPTVCNRRNSVTDQNVTDQ
jgi:hypothetical protein